MRAGGSSSFWMLMILWAGVLLVLLSMPSCTTVVTDSGCREYGVQRARMPELGADAVSVWVATTDAALTGACKG